MAGEKLDYIHNNLLQPYWQPAECQEKKIIKTKSMVRASRNI